MPVGRAFGVGPQTGPMVPPNIGLGQMTNPYNTGYGSAIGKNCTASGRYGIAWGYGNQAAMFTAGGTTTLAGYGPALGAVLIGNYNFATASSYAVVSVGLLNNQSGATISQNAAAFKGVPVAATVGANSIVFGIGNLTPSTGGISTALGYKNTVSSITSVAVGYLNSISSPAGNSIAAGSSNTITGNGNAIAVGLSNTASNTYATAIGGVNTASAAQATAVGRANIIASTDSSGFGRSNAVVSGGINCHLVGGYNFGTATSFATVNFGLLNNQQTGTLNLATGAVTNTPAAATTVGRICTAVGVLNTTAGNYSSAVGLSNSAASVSCQMFGAYNFAASSIAAVAFGLLNNQSGATLNTTTGVVTGTVVAAGTIGKLSTAVGILNATGGQRAVAVGYTNVAAGDYSTAIGYQNSMNSASLNCQLIGSWNFGTSNALGAVSVGLMNNSQSATISTSTGVITGTPVAATTIGKNSIALGLFNLTSGQSAVAVGLRNTSSGQNSTAAGYANVANGTNSQAIGSSNTASGNYAAVFGTSCQGTATKACAFGVSVVNVTTTTVEIGPGDANKISIRNGTGISYSTTQSVTSNVLDNPVNIASGQIARSTTQTGNGTTVETTFFTYTIKAGAMNTAGYVVEATSAGTFATSVNSKQIRVYLGATTILDTGASAITTAADWELRITIISSGTATQKCSVSLITSSSVLPDTTKYTSGSVDMTTDQILKITGTGTANNDLTGEMWTVKWFAAP